MRDDLNKVLCERERRGSSDHFKNYRKLKKFSGSIGEEGENLRAREGMKLRYGYHTKDLNENLNPLWGAVRKAAGKPWDKFYSELCKNFDKRSVINQHILQHLEQFVEIKNVIVEDGELYIRRAYGGKTPIKGSGVEYYVDPRDGILKKNKSMKTYKQRNAEVVAEREKQLHAVFRQLDKDNVLRFIDGVWYHFEMKAIPKGEFEIQKPYGFTEANVNPAWMKNSEPVMKTWEEMNATEKNRFGGKRLVGKAVHDVFTGRDVIDTGGAIKSASGADLPFNDRVMYRNRKYHATKQTASHKMLKAAGIVK